MSSPFLNSIAEQSQLFYIEISNFSVPVPLICKDKNSDVRFGLYSQACKDELMKEDVYLQPGMLMSYLRVAKTYTMIHKYYDESEGSYVLFFICLTNIFNEYFYIIFFVYSYPWNKDDLMLVDNQYVSQDHMSIASIHHSLLSNLLLTNLKHHYPYEVLILSMDDQDNLEY